MAEETGSTMWSIGADGSFLRASVSMVDFLWRLSQPGQREKHEARIVSLDLAALPLAASTDPDSARRATPCRDSARHVATIDKNIHSKSGCDTVSAMNTPASPAQARQEQTTAKPSDALFRVLSLDGGGSKGVYTLGVLKEVEALAGQPLCEVFDLIFGTSTGSIIAALVALGHSIPEIETLYFELIPKIMSHRSREGRTTALQAEAERVFRRRDSRNSRYQSVLSARIVT